MKELGESTFNMASSCSLVEKLEDNGIIEGDSVKVNQEKIGYFMYTFINIYIYGKNNSCTWSYMDQKQAILIFIRWKYLYRKTR
ncbi:hypothetical protein J7E63_22180 [Bacillus sp. ISL-75]|nr:hypothetical protein [Bacillus sp. ISL-75]